jgi:hypothetical protein
MLLIKKAAKKVESMSLEDLDQIWELLHPDLKRQIIKTVVSQISEEQLNETLKGGAGK